MYKVGVLGNCCTHGVGAVSSLNAREDIKIIAGYEPNPHRASELSNALGFALAESYEEICENSDVDIVVITTDPCDKAKMVEKACKAGKHIFLNKPFCPNLYIQGYYGRKEYGLWGLKYLDQHESYWEQTVPFLATMHPDIHADRINADGVRLQNWWNENFRFLPTVTNHVLTHRIQENSFDSRLPRIWDHLGWKYSFMSGLASGGSITACILPENLDNVQGIREFYQKWLIWARDNFEYVKYNVSFGEQVRVRGIDGHSRIKGDHGFIFLCNPNPRPTRIQFNLNDEVGLYEKGQFTLKELYNNFLMHLFNNTISIIKFRSIIITIFVKPPYAINYMFIQPPEPLLITVS